MKVSNTPRINKIGTEVFYLSPFGLCARQLVVPKNPRTEAQIRARGYFGESSCDWSHTFTEDQRLRWNLAAQTVASYPSLAPYSHISGQQLCAKVNSTLRLVGLSPTLEPPEPVVFSPNGVGQLSITTDETGNARLLLSVGPMAEDVMLYGQAPCSAGRMKHRRVVYLGLLGPAIAGQCDITAQYTARFGQPSPGEKIFIVTCQEKNGWKAQDHVTSAVVPPRRPSAKQQPTPAPLAAKAAPAVPATSSAGLPKPNSSASPVVYKGSTPDAPRMHKGLAGVHPLSTLCAPLVHGVRQAIVRLRMLGMPAAGFSTGAGGISQIRRRSITNGG